MWSPVIPKEAEQFSRLRTIGRLRLFLLPARRLKGLDEIATAAKCSKFALSDYEFQDSESSPADDLTPKCGFLNG
jgi:hypothetical protein